MQRKFLQPLNLNDICGLFDRYPYFDVILPNIEPWLSEYDTFSSRVNYAMIRTHKPKVVVEFGTKAGACTHDIMRGLLDNGGKFTFLPFEILPDMRKKAQENIDEEFSRKVKIGRDIMKADLPNNIDYLFVDNSHDYETTKWVFEYLLPKKCVKNCLVHIHDLVIRDEFVFEAAINEHNEISYIYDLVKANKLPLTKIFWGWETGMPMCSATWWYYDR